MAFESEVLVIGAGLAGLSCALHLQNQGVEVTILEAAEAFKRNGSSGRYRSEYSIHQRSYDPPSRCPTGVRSFPRGEAHERQTDRDSTQDFPGVGKHARAGSSQRKSLDSIEKSRKSE